jgi:FkbM family methyltransferase
MKGSGKSAVDGTLPRAWRFLHRPWHEKAKSFIFRWTSLKSQLARLLSKIPVPVRLPFGAWWLARNDVLGGMLLGAGFENAERHFVERFLQPGMTVLDIGAHHGFYTLLASKRVAAFGKVISFEPSPRERRALRLHLLLNRCRNVIVERLALGDEENESDLYVVEDWDSGCNSLRPPNVQSATSRLRVRVSCLDSWLAKRDIGRVDFIKLDVEGAELAVLAGAARLLESRLRPVILVELQDIRTGPWGYRAKDIVSHLSAMGFKWFHLFGDGSLHDLDLALDVFDGNFVAWPKELEMSLPGLRTCWEQPYEILREKWVEVPTTGEGRTRTTDLLKLPDGALLAEWQKAREDITTGAQFAHRGWYHALYADGMRGKKVMDVGSGFGVDSITFAEHGAKLTFVDLVETNLKVLERLCKIMGLDDVRFHVLENVSSLHALDTDYDVIMAMGSLHHAPVDVMKPEYQELIRHLKVGGRWLQLAYPDTRWIRDGRPPFGKWGEMTDGAGTPWCEPYNVPKLLSMFAPARFEVVLYQEFHNGDFNWFDLLYRGS